jgi:hypothetical protein
MKAQPLRLVEGEYVQCLPKLATHLKINRPGPMTSVILPVTITGVRADTPLWSWNGDVDKPTLRPSVLTRTFEGDDVKCVCHSWITDGVVKFLNDSTHSLAGTSQDLLEID